MKFSDTNDEFQQKIDNSRGFFKDEFAGLNLIKDSNYKELYNQNQENMFINIVQDIKSDSIVMLEVDKYNEDILFIVNGEKFKIESLNGDVNLISENGAKLPIIEEEITSSLEANSRESLKENEIVYSGARGYMYGPYYNRSGPATSTNKAWVDVIEVLSLATGGASLVIKHPVLGAISFFSAVVVSVGSRLYATLYVEKYHSYNETYTWILEEIYYYNYNNYTGLVESTIEEIPNRWS